MVAELDPRWWIHGLRPAASSTVNETVFAHLTGAWPRSSGTGLKTAEAERALGFLPSVYFYVLRADRSFGLVVFAYRPLVAADESERGVCPFDSGGVYHGHIALRGLWSSEEERLAAAVAFVRREDVALSAWGACFQAFIDADHAGDLRPYLDGTRPRALRGGLDEARNNDARAWIWEARIPKSVAVERLVLEKLFWSKMDSNVFASWAFPFADRRRSLAEVSRVEELCDEGDVYSRVEQWLKGASS